jgi:phosphoenolpyruvate phosphomutase
MVTQECNKKAEPPTRKTVILKRLIQSEETNFLMEAHSGLSAKIAEEAGFAGIWASGLSISALLGVRDNNEASWTQVLEVAEFMSDATSVPILLDGDTGYGNFNSVRRLVRKLEQRGIAGVCIEDKLFPKINSFIRGKSQPLADVEEFCGKIRAGKDSQLDDDFVIVARVEALIAGRGLGEALRRAEAYQEAGADAILIHSAAADASEVLAFKQEWGDRAPVVIVPTKYYTTPTRVFREAGFSVVIWANHLLRSSLVAMQETAREIFTRQSLFEIEGRVASLNEVFRLQDAPELERAERLYLPTSEAPATARITDFTLDDSSRREMDDEPAAPQTWRAYELVSGGRR